MLNLPVKPNQFIGPAVVFALATALYFGEPQTSDLFAYTRGDIFNGQIWRILTGHMLHTNLNHLLLNSLGLALLWGLHGSYYSTKSYFGYVLYFALFISLALLWFVDDLHWYVGLSGVLHGLFTVGAIKDIQHGLKSGWLLLAGISIKVIYEQISGPSAEIANLIDARVAIEAHFAGWLAGIVTFTGLLTKPGKR